MKAMLCKITDIQTRKAAEDWARTTQADLHEYPQSRMKRGEGAVVVLLPLRRVAQSGRTTMPQRLHSKFARAWNQCNMLTIAGYVQRDLDALREQLEAEHRTVIQAVMRAVDHAKATTKPKQQQGLTVEPRGP